MEAVLRDSPEETDTERMQTNPDIDSSNLPIELESQTLGTATVEGDSMPPQDVPSHENEATVNEPEDAEEVAIAHAISSANAAYVPPAAVLHDSTPHPLLASIDGPPLASYDRNPSTYTARNIPVAVRSKLTVPIYVNNSGSIVDYVLESQYYDIGFGVVAEREDGSTIVTELARVDSNLAPIAGRFLVISVPCALVFTFDNDYSWFREKSISYRITITPPDLKHLVHARKVRAEIALHHVLEDKHAAEKRLEKVASKRTSLLEDIELLEKELAEKRKTLHAVTNEEEWLLQRVALRRIQEEEIDKRQKRNWADESEDLTTCPPDGIHSTSTVERYEI